MADEEIEFALQQYVIGGGKNVQNMDWVGVLDYIHRLKAENAMLRISDDSKGKCTLEQHGEIHRLQDELKQVRKDTAKEIFQAIYNWEEIGFFKIKWFAKEYYGIEVDDE